MISSSLWPGLCERTLNGYEKLSLNLAVSVRKPEHGLRSYSGSAHDWYATESVPPVGLDLNLVPISLRRGSEWYDSANLELPPAYRHPRE